MREQCDEVLPCHAEAPGGSGHRPVTGTAREFKCVSAAVDIVVRHKLVSTWVADPVERRLHRDRRG